MLFFTFEFFDILHIFVPSFPSHRIVLIPVDFIIHCVMSHSCILTRDFFFSLQGFTYIHRNANEFPRPSQLVLLTLCGFKPYNISAYTDTTQQLRKRIELLGH